MSNMQITQYFAKAKCYLCDELLTEDQYYEHMDKHYENGDMRYEDGMEMITCYSEITDRIDATQQTDEISYFEGNLVLKEIIPS